MRQIEADQPAMALRDLAPHEPPIPSKPQVNNHTGGSPVPTFVEVLTVVSHLQAADLRALPHPGARQLRACRETEREPSVDRVTSVKRLLHTAGVRRAPSTRGFEKATPITTST